jgi:hypothetical protein
MKIAVRSESTAPRRVADTEFLIDMAGFTHPAQNHVWHSACQICQGRKRALPSAGARIHGGMMKAPVAQFPQASMEPEAELFFDESLSRIPSVDWKEIQRLSRFLPVLVFIPRTTGKYQVAPRKESAHKPSGEGSGTTKLFGVFEKAMERFKSTGSESRFSVAREKIFANRKV